MYAVSKEHKGTKLFAKTRRGILFISECFEWNLIILHFLALPAKLENLDNSRDSNRRDLASLPVNEKYAM